ncbi:hypothetical protein BJ170DRAFT_590645 [Xylariales sp. AK1849]|nr:hypothetical protein BJ170DRAFT_590645 [Xylariales sp. AK1849]
MAISTSFSSNSNGMYQTPPALVQMEMRARALPKVVNGFPRYAWIQPQGMGAVVAPYENKVYNIKVCLFLRPTELSLVQDNGPTVEDPYEPATAKAIESNIVEKVQRWAQRKRTIQESPEKRTVLPELGWRVHQMGNLSDSPEVDRYNMLAQKDRADTWVYFSSLLLRDIMTVDPAGDARERLFSSCMKSMQMNNMQKARTAWRSEGSVEQS